MKLTLKNIKSIKSKAISPLKKRVCSYIITEWSDYESIQSEIMEHFASVMPQFELYPFQSAGARDSIISGLLEGQYPIERIDGLPYRTIK